MARLEAGVDQALPDGGQLLDAGAEQVDALAAGDLRVEAEVLGDLADGDELLGRDLAAGDAGHDRVGAVPLDVGEEVVVGVLERRPARRRGCSRCRATPGSTPTAGLQISQPRPRAVAGEHLGERSSAVDPDEVEQLLAAVGEVLAQGVATSTPASASSCLQQVGRPAGRSRRSRCRPGWRPSASPTSWQPVGDGRADGALRRRSRTSRSSRRRPGADADRGGRAAAEVGEDQRLGVLGRRHVAPGHLQERAVGGGVADEDAAEHLRRRRRRRRAACRRRRPGRRRRSRGRRRSVANASPKLATSTPSSLSLVRQVGAGEARSSRGSVADAVSGEVRRSDGRAIS